MAIAVKLRCSECETTYPTDLNPEEREIVCPVCGRRMQNLTQAEHSEIEAVQKRQQLLGIIALVFFALSVVCLIMWMGSNWSYKVDAGRVQVPPEANTGLMIGTFVCGLITAVLGGMASAKRFVVEF